MDCKLLLSSIMKAKERIAQFLVTGRNWGRKPATAPKHIRVIIDSTNALDEILDSIAVVHADLSSAVKMIPEGNGCKVILEVDDHDRVHRILGALNGIEVSVSILLSRYLQVIAGAVVEESKA